MPLSKSQKRASGEEHRYVTSKLLRSVGYIADPHTGQVIEARADGSSPVLDSVRDCILIIIIRGTGLI